MSFFTELKQRRIVQIVVSYMVSGWVCLEVVGALIERGMLGELVYQVGFIVFLGGLAASLVVGWYHGEKGAQEATSLEISVLVAIAAVTGFYGYQAIQDARARALADAPGSGRFEVRRIGVLYFEDRSRSDDLGYLADGMTEALIDRLSDVSGLDVISSSGSEQFRDSDLPLDSIASILSAGTLVDGFVEQRGNDVRVSFSLIDGESGAELGSDQVEASAEDLFELQDRLAEDVAELLRTMVGEEISVRRARRGTDNVAAWVTYRRAAQAREDAEELLDQDDVRGFIDGYQRADSLLETASGMDPGWVDPVILRARLAYRWGELTSDEPPEAREWLDLATQRAEIAMAMDPRNGLAHYVRGLVRYWTWLNGLAVGPSEAEQAFDGALEDLEQAVALDPKLAAAWNVLSIVKSQIPDVVGANLAARSAYEADEFLSSAGSVLQRLYTTSYDLENFPQAVQYCDEGRRRFPQASVFTECQLWLMASRAMEADPERAWRIRDEYLAMVPEAALPRERVQTQLLVAIVLARAELADSALAVAERAQPTPDIDPTRELLGVEALVHLELDDPETALDRLAVYLTVSPDHKEGWRWTSHWWWRPLQDDPGFRRLIGS